jgi:putative FmdB family regulatory protein
MPLYLYHCKVCDERMDIRQSFSDEPLDVCPNCGAVGQINRLITPAGVIFKGAGFYVTDNKGTNPAAPKTSKSDNGSIAPEKAGESKSGESKAVESKSSESKTESKSVKASPSAKSTD